MFESLSTLPADPILGLGQSFKQDPNPDKISLSVGVYQDESGATPIFTAVKKAEQQLISAQTSKAYIAQAGDERFLDGMSRLILGEELRDSLGNRMAAVMTPGGCGALRVSAEMLVAASSGSRLWVSDPTWGNHYPLLQSAGLELKEYRYYDTQIKGINFQAMLDDLGQIPSGDSVLLHGCCHNPTGADLTTDQWDQVIALLAERQLLPFFDVAYQGFGDGLEADAYSVRQAVKLLPEVLIAASCSKNFGLYRERTGVAIIISQSAQATSAANSHILSAARRSYSLSPYHGAGIAGLVMSDSQLKLEWMDELESVRNRMNRLRVELAQGLNQAQSKIDFSFVARSKGMFCFLGISREQVLQLRSEYGIYLLESTRINIAGLSDTNLSTIIERAAEVVTR
jgi:aspartate aminotransferase